MCALHNLQVVLLVTLYSTPTMGDMLDQAAVANPEIIQIDTEYEEPMNFESLCMECMNNVRS